jgi:mannose-6-phosphate isomerase
MLYPFVFEPIFKERVWGGRNLQQLYRKDLPPNVPIGESWEITDRPEGVSVILNGPLAGKTLHWLVENHRRELLGSSELSHGRFPLLIKILDANDKLSLQVHPPPSAAEQLGGEPKTEMWYIAHAEPGAELYVGLKRGVSRAEFEKKIANGEVADCFHRVPVNTGDAMFLPSGRLHAIGAGLVIFEIQQNSDTTYRVFDWNRVGLDGKPRALHIQESLASINFQDFEPKKIESKLVPADGFEKRTLVKDRLFDVALVKLASGRPANMTSDRLQIFGVLTGEMEVKSGGEKLIVGSGQFCLIPACLSDVEVSADGVPVTFLHTQPGTNR